MFLVTVLVSPVPESASYFSPNVNETVIDYKFVLLIIVYLFPSIEISTSGFVPEITFLLIMPNPKFKLWIILNETRFSWQVLSKSNIIYLLRSSIDRNFLGIQKNTFRLFVPYLMICLLFEFLKCINQVYNLKYSCGLNLLKCNPNR